MERTLPALGPVVLFKRAALIAGALFLLACNLIGLWLIFTNLGHVLGFADWNRLNGLDAWHPYDWGEYYRWAPPAIWIWQAGITPLGFGLWAALHFGALAFLRDWRAIGLVLATFPFWFDVANGAPLTFIFVAAWCALRGSRVATVAYIAAFALMPRPLMLPVLAWLLWHRRDAWYALAVSGVLVLASSLWLGLLDEWIVRLLNTNEVESGALWNMAPWAPLGMWWLPIGAALAAWLTWKGRLGLASIVASPYWLPYYLVFAVLELAHQPVGDGEHPREGAGGARLVHVVAQRSDIGMDRVDGRSTARPAR